MTHDLMTDIRRVVSSVDPDGDLVACGIRSLDIGDGAAALLPARVRAVLGDRTGARVLLLVDPVEIRAAGAALKPAVAAALGAEHSVRVEVVDDGHPELHASDAVVDDAVARVGDAEVVVTVGGGTVTDIGKLVCLRSGIPHVVVQTAASVDGFTDDVSVILRNGVKRTVPSRWPDAVLADTAVIREAPAAMNRAGFGEICSMFTAPADWRLAGLLGFDDSYHPGPVAMLAEVGAGLEDWSPGLATAESDAVARLVRALDMRGVATGVAGTTACLSGVEHLVSHMLDISNAAHGRPTGLHGAQVGVGSVVAAAAWELLFDRIGKGSVSVERSIDRSAFDYTVREAFGDLDAAGALAAECLREYGKKLDTWTGNIDRVEGLLAEWPTHAVGLRSLVRGPDELARALRAAGSAATFADLGVGEDLARWAVRNLSLMRNRFTVVDLLTLLGGWDDVDVDHVLARAVSAGETVAA